MTGRPDDPDRRAADGDADSSDSGDDRAPGIYRRPRRRGADLRDQVRTSEPPKQESRAEAEDSQSGIYAPPRRRSVRRDSEDSKPGIFSRLSGRRRLDEIRAERYEPYTYESNGQNVKWTTVAMGVWCLVLIWLALTDYSNSNRYEEWVERGVTMIPPSAELSQQIEPARTYAQREGGEEFKCAYLGGRSSTDECPDGETDALLVSNFIDESGALCTNFGEYTEPSIEKVPDDEAVTTGLETGEPEPVEVCTAVWSYYPLLEFSRQTGLECPDVDAILASLASESLEYPDCETAFTYAEGFQSSQDRSRMIWLLAVFVSIVVAFPYLSLVHRASRNLLPLKSEGQKHTPEWGVLHHFIPILNWFRVGGVLMELYRGSDPDISTEDSATWKKTGQVRAIVFLWWILWVAAWIWNPITVPRFVNAQSLPELIDANDLLILSDVLLIGLGVVAVLMLRQLHVLQEMRFSKIGLITVTPPPPVDPLAEALKKQEAKERDKQEKKKRRGR